VCIKIAEARVAEARDATAQMQQNLEAPRKIEQTLELLCSRCNDNKKPKAT
jgi:hypothetical protein